MGKRVLVCDDSLLMRRMIAETLVSAEWEVVAEAINGQDAIEKYQQYRPDAVTLDLVMPEWDGLHALAGIMAIDPAAKIVVVSAVEQTKAISDAIRRGAHDFIVKPFSPPQLQETLENCLGLQTV